MKMYQVRYVDGNGDTLYWCCRADDYDHAVEQLVDHERTVSGSVQFHMQVKWE